MIDSLAEKGQEALKELSKKSQQEINDIVHQMSMAAVDQHMHLAKLAYDETGRGIYEDKAIKIYMPQSTYGIQSKTIKQ